MKNIISKTTRKNNKLNNLMQILKESERKKPTVHFLTTLPPRPIYESDVKSSENKLRRKKPVLCMR